MWSGIVTPEILYDTCLTPHLCSGPGPVGGLRPMFPSTPEVMMPDTETPPTTPPPAVWIVALVLTFFGVWQLLTRAVPAFAAGDPEAFSAAISVMVSAAIVWGLLRLRPWARSFALVISGFGVVIAAAALALLQQPDLAATVAAEGYDTAVLARMLTVLGVLAALSVILLRTASAKRAFGL